MTNKRLIIQLNLSITATLGRVNPFTPKSAKLKTEEKIRNFILKNCKKQTVPNESTAQ